MDVAMEQQVRERAYQIWIEAGMVQGFENDHWVAAERDVSAKMTVSKRATASRAKPVTVKALAAKSAAAKPTAAKAKGKSPKAAIADARGSLN